MIIRLFHFDNPNEKVASLWRYIRTQTAKKSGVAIFWKFAAPIANALLPIIKNSARAIL